MTEREREIKVEKSDFNIDGYAHHHAGNLSTGADDYDFLLNSDKENIDLTRQAVHRLRA
jgi:hypothetical protein